MTILAAAGLLLAACGGDDTTGPTEDPTSPTDGSPSDGVVTLAWEFDDGSDGWASQITDFTEATRPDDALSETMVSPPGIDAGTDFFHLAASNRSDDLFFYIFEQLSPERGLAPDTTYEATFTVEFASNAPSNCAGIGGAPGESVWLKVGASAEEPVPVMEDGQSRLTVDKGGQSQGGDAAVVAGTIDNGIPCEEALESDDPPYAMVTRTGTLDAVTTDDDGSVWLFVGTDSGFEGRTSIYYDRVEVTMTPTAA